LDYQERIKSTGGDSRGEQALPVVRAREIIESRMERIETTEHIHTLEIEVDSKAAVALRNIKVEGNRRLAGGTNILLRDGKRRIRLPNEEKEK